MHKNEEQRFLILSSTILGLIVFLFIMICPKYNLYAQGIYQYPIRPGTQAWVSLKTHEEMVNACRIPENILETMTTSELIQVCFDYPLIADFYLYNNLQQGFDSLLRNSNAFQELLQRNNAGELLLSKYKNQETYVNYDTHYQNGKHVALLILMEVTIAQEEIMNTLPVPDTIELCNEGIKKYDAKIENPDIYGSLSKTASSYMILKAMNRIINDNVGMFQYKQRHSIQEIERIRKKYDSDEAIKTFIETSGVLDNRVINEIPNDAKLLLMRKVKG